MTEPQKHHYSCAKCKYEWKPKKLNPKTCPHCGTNYWKMGVIPSRKMSRKMSDEEKKARAKAYKESFKPMPDIEIPCRCPRCERIYIISDRPPLPKKPLRRFCDNCRTFADNTSDDEYSMRVY